MPRTVLQAIPLSEEDSDPQLSASSGDAVTETSDDGGKNLQPDFAVRARSCTSAASS